MTAAPAITLTEEEQQAADALWKAVAAGTLYALLRQSDARRRLLIEKMIVRQERVLGDIGQQLIDGAIGLDTWEQTTRQSLAPLYLAATAATLGGFPNVNDAAAIALIGAAALQYAYLRRFRLQIQAAEQLLDATLKARMTLYARASWSVAQRVEREWMRDAGKTEERRVLGVADHCSSTGGLASCPELARRGWQPIGTLPAIGETPCRVNCRCSFSYR